MIAINDVYCVALVCRMYVKKESLVEVGVG